ncbi:MAG TPA: MBL fold metallo-hydrolase [Gemmatimonadaceae bacterium]
MRDATVPPAKRPIHLGRLELYLLDDGTLPFPAHFYFANVPEDVWRRSVRTEANGTLDVGHTCCLVRSARELIAIDTGYGDDTHAGRTGHLLADLARTGFEPEQVTMVVNTHAHGDHTKGNTRVRDGRRVPTFPRARYHLGRADWDWFDGPAGRVHEFDEQLGTLRRLGVLTLVEGGETLAPGVTLYATPGHTPGHLSVVLESEGATAIVLGDVCHLTAHIEHPEWVSTFDTHPEQTPCTRADLFGFALERGALLICPHVPWPSTGRLQRTSDGVRWRPMGGGR